MKRLSLNRRITARVEEEHGNELRLVPVKVFLRYDIADPYAVRLDFTGIRVPVTWTIARDLLAEGLHFGVGDGDVYVAPDSEDADRVWIVLTSPTGTAHLAFVRDQLADVLEETNQLVAPGSESERIDWDRELALLGGEAA